MYKLLISLATLSLISINVVVDAQTADSTSTVPTEVGTTTMPPGQYAVTDEGSGKKYSLVVTAKGTMVLGPASASTATPTTPSKASGLEGLAESQMKKNMTNMVEKQGMNEIKGFIK